MTRLPLERYGRPAILLHWIIAVLIVANVILGLGVDALPDGWVRPVIDTHKSIGITVLGLALLRFLWRVSHPAPPLPKTYARWERRAAHLVHVCLYVLIFAIPLSGWLHDSAWKDAATHPMRWFNLFEWPRIGWIMRVAPPAKESLHTLFGRVHAVLGYVLYGLVAVHVGGALKHQLIDKHPELQRISW